MKKETFYFSHDYNSRSDEKIKSLIRKHGYSGYGLFWAIIEDLYMNANAMRTDYDGIAFDLRSDKKIIESIIKDFDLFVFDGDFFGSLSVQKRIEERNQKSIKAKESAFKRWNNDANAMRTQCERNAIKESKGKERKVKEKKIKEELTLPFSSIEFLKIWNELLIQPKWKKKTNSALKLSLEKLQQFDEQTAIQMIKNTIAGGWQGIFEIDKKQNKTIVQKSGPMDLLNSFNHVIKNQQNESIDNS